jgi:formylglycine-generating enzyme required for sulfatase activity
MELGDSTLQDRLLRPQRVTADEARTLARQVAEALAFLAEKGAVHRDVKPENLFRVNGGWKLGDFGLARGVAGSRIQASGRKGTLLYMAPEAVRREVGPATDVWALGAILQQALCGRLPYEATDDDEAAFIAQLITEEPFVAPDLPPPLDAVVRGCLQRERTTRWTAQRVLEALEGAAAAFRSPLPAAPVAPVTAVHPARASASRPGMLALGPNPQGFQEYRNEKDGSVLIHVPAGAFTMGSNDWNSEKPPHRVTLQPYLIGKFPVTAAQFRGFVRATGHKAAGGWELYAREWGDDCPVVDVSWHDAEAYCRWAGLRLPTEPEWEYAARGPQSRVYPWGDAWDPERAWWSENSSNRAHPVGTKPSGASPFGALDMAGNVYEWTASWYDRYPGNRDSDNDFGQKYRVLRGGSWYITYPQNLRGANRGRDYPVDWDSDSGFRVSGSVSPGP